MDLLLLSTLTWLPTKLIEGYESFIWTERSTKSPGDFQIKTKLVKQTLTVLNEYSYITHRHTRQVAKCEDFIVDEADDGEETLTITGRTVEAPWLEVRPFKVVGNFWRVRDLKASPMYLQTSAEFAEMVIWNAVANNTGLDAFSSPVAPFSNRSVYDDMGVEVSHSSAVNDMENVRVLNSGDIYSQIMDALGESGNAIRSIRPNEDSYNFTLTAQNPVRESVAIRSVSTVNNKDADYLRLDVYSGTDRTRGQSVVKPVIFRDLSDDIESPNYAQSNREFRNVLRVTSNTAEFWMWVDLAGVIHESFDDDATLYSGVGRLVGVLDCGSQDELVSNDQWLDIMRGLARKEFKRKAKRTVLSFKVSDTSKYKYGVDYFLNDQVTVVGKYGVDQTMIVSEYIRTDDEDGDSGYPAFTLVT